MSSQRKRAKGGGRIGGAVGRRDCPAVSAAIRDAHVPRWVLDICERTADGAWFDGGGDEPMAGDSASYATAMRNQAHDADIGAHSDNGSEEIILTFGGGD